MDRYMITQRARRVLERLVYEGILLHNQYEGRRWRISLDDLMEAGTIEPRVWELLPGILLHRPALIYRGRQALKQSPELQQLLAHLPLAPPGDTWRGLPFSDLRRTAERIAHLQSHRRHRQRWRNLNIRVAEEDLTRLQMLSTREGRTKSEVLRSLIADAAVSIR